MNTESITQIAEAIELLEKGERLSVGMCADRAKDDRFFVLKRIREALILLAEAEKDYNKISNRIVEIENLCTNCRNLSDAQVIAGGEENSSTENGCYKCEVDKLQARLQKAEAEMVQLKEFKKIVLSCREKVAVYAGKFKKFKEKDNG